LKPEYSGSREEEPGKPMKRGIIIIIIIKENFPHSLNGRTNTDVQGNISKYFNFGENFLLPQVSHFITCILLISPVHCLQMPHIVL
jgi:hypothetical protein